MRTLELERRIFECQSFTNAYPIRNGTASTMSCSCPSDAQSNIRADAPSSGTDFPCAGPAKGMSDYRRTPDAGPCADVHRDSPQAPSSFGDRIFEGEECNCDCRSEEHTSELQSHLNIVCRLLLEKKKQ